MYCNGRTTYRCSHSYVIAQREERFYHHRDGSDDLQPLAYHVFICISFRLFHNNCWLKERLRFASLGHCGFALPFRLGPPKISHSPLRIGVSYNCFISGFPISQLRWLGLWVRGWRAPRPCSLQLHMPDGGAVAWAPRGGPD